ncbi:OB-fold domain-containing protein [Actinomadura sp. HBU206391]|nr:OB-fold domain-containing protein [Actinomadura sp. HBU206391]
MALADALGAEGELAAPPCPDPVNPAMIRNWTQAMGDDNPLYARFAPPAMIQVWSMQGLGARRAGSVVDELLGLLDGAGFTGVVATNCEQNYDRYLRHGEQLRSTMRFGSIAGPKRTALGEGYFVTWHQTWYDERDELVADMLFRVLKFRPPERAVRPGAAKGGSPPAPAIGPDTRFFWDGVAEGELRVQKCEECGRLRHPPGPMCPHCHALERGHVVASGRGELHSYVVHHHPPVPGRATPYVVGLVELEEGVRMVGNVIGCSPGDVRIGMPVRLAFERVGDDLTLPQWTPADRGLPPDHGGEGADSDAEPVPEGREADGGADLLAGAVSTARIEIPLTPTFVIATALATRDFTPVHHDVGLARAQGAKDIFLNILTTMGLVQRFVTEALPGVTVESSAVRLGVPAYAGDTLTLTGRLVDDRTVEVRGAVALGDHVTATVRLGSRS